MAEPLPMVIIHVWAFGWCPFKGDSDCQGVERISQHYLSAKKQKESSGARVKRFLYHKSDSLSLSVQEKTVEVSDWRKNVEAMSGMEGRKKMFDVEKGANQ